MAMFYFLTEKYRLAKYLRLARDIRYIYYLSDTIKIPK